MVRIRRQRKGYRRTLVGSKPRQSPQAYTISSNVTDEPSWGRSREQQERRRQQPTVTDEPSWGRSNHSRHRGEVYQGVTDKPSWGRSAIDSIITVHARGYRRTLVGSKRHRRWRAAPRWWLQTNPRGVEALYRKYGTVIKALQTNPRGVEATSPLGLSVSAIVTDEPSWGRSTELRRRGRRRLKLQTNPRGVEAVRSPSTYSACSCYRRTLVGSKCCANGVACNKPRTGLLKDDQKFLL